jgi:hypothetical protein
MRHKRKARPLAYEIHAEKDIKKHQPKKLVFIVYALYLSSLAAMLAMSL